MCEEVTESCADPFGCRLAGGQRSSVAYLERLWSRLRRAGLVDSARGRSGGYRTLIALQAARRSVFLYGLAKSERDNINPGKLAELKTLARQFVSLTDSEIEKLLNASDIRELDYHGQEQED